MKKNIKNRIPKYKFGASDVTNIISGLGQFAGQTVSSTNQKADPLGGALSGMSAGASIGSFGGPIGAGIGAAVGAAGGAIMGLIGNKGSVDPITGEITYGSGIKGRKGPSDEELEQMSGMIKNNNANRQNSQIYANQYYQNNGVNDISYVSKGGTVPNTLAYLDDGELLRTPDGNIVEVPEEGKPTDSNLANVPVGTQVLSDKLKVPGTKKTFAQMGKSIMKNKKYGIDIYAQNSKKLNDMNNQIAYDELLALQENMKTKKNGKKRGIQKAVFGEDSLQGDYIGEQYPTNALQNNKPQYKAQRYLNLFNDGAAIKSGIVNPGWSHGTVYNPNFSAPNYGGVDLSNYNFNVGKKTNSTSKKVKSDFKSQDDAPTKATPRKESLTQMAKYDIYPDKIEIPTGVYDSQIPDNTNGKNYNFTKSFLPQLGSLTSSILAARQNIKDSDPEYVQTYSYSPQFVPVDYNIEPLLNEINRSDAIARYNNRNIGGGASLAQGVQLAVARDKAVAEAYNMKRNAENNVRATNANIYNQWGQFDANARKVAATENAQNRAAARNIRRQGISQLGTIVPSFIKDMRLESRDAAMFNAMLPYLEYGMTKDQINKLTKLFG